MDPVTLVRLPNVDVRTLSGKSLTNDYWSLAIEKCGDYLLVLS